MAAAALAGEPRPTYLGRDYLRSRATVLLHVLVALWVFSGGFVLGEPAPYEVLFLAVVVLGAAGGWVVHRRTAPLLVLWMAFLPFALIGAFQARHMALTDALLFNVVTAFLFFTACFTADYVAEAPQQRMRLIVRAYTAGAVICALAGILGYFGLIPGAETFVRYGRAKGFFQDPNVFGPYLILPAMYLLQKVLLGTPRQTIWAGALFMVLLVGVFASFSRAAWGSLGAAALLVFVAVFVLIANAREKARMLILSIGGVLVVVVAIGGLLSIPSVQRLFEVRATDQSYDEGETGRFGRQGYAFELALANPLGIGPLEFRYTHVTEEPHNSYVTVLHHYGWGGGLAFLVLVLATLWRGISVLFQPSPNRLLMIPLLATYVPLVLEAAIIDLDHWRHFYLLAGLIWGVAAGYHKTEPPGTVSRPALI